MYGNTGLTAAGKDGLKTLIVDNSPQVREHLISLVSHLERIQLVGQAGDVAEAMQAIQTLKPDIIIMDPLTPGGQTLQQIKALSPDSIIVMLAFYPHSRYRNQYLLAGADYVLDKLTEVKKVSQVLESLI
ncbi:MAG: response regulator transcription factor [Anaerolineales bacterium]